MYKRLMLAAISLAALVPLLTLAPTVSSAQRGGSGGGFRSAGRHLLTMDYTPAINGRIPSGLASYTISTYQTTLTYNMKVSNVDLPDGTQLDVYAYVTEWFSRITPVQVKIKAGTMSLLARKGVLDLTAIAIAPSGFLPDLSSVVVVAPDGSIVMSGHP